MKVGILTASRTDNNGTDLQSVAMLNLFKSFETDTHVINYSCKKIDTKKSKLFPLTLRSIVKFPMNLYNKLSHRRFRKKTLGNRNEIVYLNTLNKTDFDLIVVGSDQIWNLNITGNDLGFFLPFKSERLKKYSYAASLGMTDISEWERKYSISSYLGDFSGVSVREESGVIALEKIGVKARHDLDPILMGNKEDWIYLFTKNVPKKPYLFYYSVEHNESAENYAKSYAINNGLMFIQACNRVIPKKGIKTKRFMSVEQWLTYVNNAEIIFTNSYHCLSFAILFKKDIRVFLLKKGTQSNTRMMGLMHQINFDDMILNENYVEPINKINWEHIETILATEREKSKMYIKSMFG